MKARCIVVIVVMFCTWRHGFHVLSRHGFCITFVKNVMNLRVLIKTYLFAFRCLCPQCRPFTPQFPSDQNSGIFVRFVVRNVVVGRKGRALPITMSKVIFPVAWAELTHILSFLGPKEIQLCRMLCRFGFVHMFLRERDSRKGNPNLCVRFLPRLVKHERVVLVSYPRSGNTYLRRLLEETTGIVTGSDSRTNRPLCSSLLQCGFRGEGIVDSSVWVVKSHYPERMGYLKFSCDRVILLVRNPWDAIESYFHMGLTGTHDKVLHQEELDKLTEMYREFIPNEAKVWNDFHAWWSNYTLLSKLPVHVVRYEDLLNRPQVNIVVSCRLRSSGSV